MFSATTCVLLSLATKFFYHMRLATKQWEQVLRAGGELARSYVGRENEGERVERLSKRSLEVCGNAR